MKHRILVADDDEASVSGLAVLLSSWGYEVQEAADGEEALTKALAFQPDVIITDLIMPRLDGLALLKSLTVELPGSTVIVLTGHATIETAVASMKEGAYDYLTKPMDIQRLRLLIEKALERSEVMREVTLLRRQLRDSRGLGRLLGTSTPMQEVYHLIDLAAATAAPVLVSGESGTGKELVARTIHELSSRRGEAFVAVNCSAVPESLLESELFGHEKGAFTGAFERRAGYFELADRGTIFLDEIAEMSPSLQAKYLRVLEQGSLRRLGGRAEVKVDVRIVAATNRDPLRAIKAGAFREDLYYRLNVFGIVMPPLRERREDIPLLVDAFIHEFDTTYDKRVRAADDEAMELLRGHSWPGNVRELRNTIERAVVACEGDLLRPKHVPFGPRRPAAPPDPADALTVPLGTTIRHAERELILRTLASVGNNKTRAAEMLGISLKTLHNRLHQYKVDDIPGH
jgi:DNA-binding NtrC family response regulator